MELGNFDYFMFGVLGCLLLGTIIWGIGIWYSERKEQKEWELTNKIIEIARECIKEDKGLCEFKKALEKEHKKNGKKKTAKD